MLTPNQNDITRQALLDAGWTAHYLDLEYVYGKSIGPVVASPSLGKHLFYVKWDRENKDIIREIGCIEDTGEFSDETVHATNIHNMYELMLWVRLTGEEA